MQWDRAPRERARAAIAGAYAGQCASRVVAVSDSARRAYLATGWDSPHRVVTVRNGTAARPRPGAGAAVRAELGLAPDDLVVRMVTVLRGGKGHELAIAATRELCARFPRLRLLSPATAPRAPRSGGWPPRSETRQSSRDIATT